MEVAEEGVDRHVRTASGDLNIRVADYFVYAAAAAPIVGMGVYAVLAVASGDARPPVWAVWVVFCAAVFSAICLVTGSAVAVLEGPLKENLSGQLSSRVDAVYAEVPWYRRSGTMTAFILIGFLLLPPLLWAACVICLTGEVYNKRLTKDGALSRWSVGNKVAALVILLLQAAGIARQLGAFG